MSYFEIEYNKWLIFPAILGIWRLSSYIILKAIPSILYKPYTKNNAKYSNEFSIKDITMVVPVYQADLDFSSCFESWIINNPYRILLIVDYTSFNEINKIILNIKNSKFYIHYQLDKFITYEENVKKLHSLYTIYKDTDIIYLEVVNQELPGKRQALYDGYLQVNTKLILYVDDDVFYPEDFLENLILPMNALDKNNNNKLIGGIGAKQMGRPKPNKNWNMWDIIMDMRLYQRMIEIRATTKIGGGSACISGRTELYRMAVFQECSNFKEYFLNEYFLGKKQLSGDDKCMTRICINSRYNMYHQISSKTCLTTKFEDPPILFKQILRWARNTIRSDFKALLIEKNIWKKYPFLSLIMIDRFIAPFSMITGLIILIIGTIIKKNLFIITLGLAYIVIVRICKLIPYFTCVENKRPLTWIIYIPLFILAQYAGAIMTIFAMTTLKNRKWGNREIEVDDDNNIIRTTENYIEINNEI